MTVYTVTQAAARLGYSRAQLYGMIARGEIGHVRRPRGHYRILDVHIDAWIEKHQCPAQPSPPASSADTDATTGTSRTETITTLRAQQIAERRSGGWTPTSTASPGR